MTSVSYVIHRLHFIHVTIFICSQPCWGGRDSSPLGKAKQCHHSNGHDPGSTAMGAEETLHWQNAAKQYIWLLPGTRMDSTNSSYTD